MTKQYRKKKALEHLKDAQENMLDADAEYTSDRDKEANYHILMSIGESLLAIAFILGMKEDLYVDGDRFMESREQL
jgi:hypothetical protein